MENQAQPEPETITKKVILLGNPAVGKTSIFNRLTTNTYFEEGITTTSAFHKQIDCPSADSAFRLKINLWDTAG